MQNSISPGLRFAAVAAVGAVLLPSCSKTAPAPATTIIVQMPTAAPAAKSDADNDDIADLRDSDDSSAPKSAAKTRSEPTDRDVEDPAPRARKAASKPASAGSSKSQLLDYYDELPAKHFADFGKVNRRSLLNRKGTIVDYEKKFIQIPGDGVNSYKLGHTRYFQMTLFPNGNNPWCAVSKIVWAVGSLEPGALDFYYKDDGVFTGIGSEMIQVGGSGGEGYESAWLPRKGLDIIVSASDEREAGSGTVYHYNPGRPGDLSFDRIKN